MGWVTEEHWFVEVYEKLAEGHMHWVLIVGVLAMVHMDWMVEEGLGKRLAAEVVQRLVAKVVLLMTGRRQQERSDLGHWGHATEER